MSITADDTIATLRAVVKGKEGFHYKPPDGDTCVYICGGKPSCLVGHVLYSLGWPVERLMDFDSQRSNGIGSLRVCYGDIATQDAVDILEAAQDTQDLGGSWGEALAQAEALYARKAGG